MIGKTFRFDEEQIKEFERLYPDLLSIYLRRCVDLAVKSRSEFERIFFSVAPFNGSIPN